MPVSPKRPSPSDTPGIPPGPEGSGRGLGAVLLGAFLLLFPGAAHSGVRVLVTLAPVANLVRDVAGDRAEVLVLFPPGMYPGSAGPGPVLNGNMSGTVLYVKIGSGFEGSLDRRVIEAVTGRLAVLNLTEGMDLLGESKPEEAERKIFSAALGVDGRSGGGTNPFIWLDPVKAGRIAGRVADSLAALLPMEGEGFHRRAGALRSRLDELDKEVRAALAGARERRFVTFTGSWSYFAARYGLREVPVTGVTPGGGPGRQSLKGTVAGIRSLGVDTVFTDETFPLRPAEEAAAQAGVTLLRLHPFGIPERGRSDYFVLMRHNLGIIAAGLRAQPRRIP